MDELLIYLLVGIFQLLRWIFKSLFRLLSGAGRREREQELQAQRAPARLVSRPAKKTAAPARAARPAAPQKPRIQFYVSIDDVPPPPPPSDVPPPPRPRLARRAAPTPTVEELTSPEVVRDAIVLGALLHRRGRR